MAADEHNPSRREVLGAAVGFPLLGVVGAEGASPPASASGFGGSPSPANAGEDWSKAFAAFRSAEAKVRAAERATSGQSAEAEEIWLPVYEARLDALSGAVRKVMLAGAPDFAAFASKMELFFEHELEPQSVKGAVLIAIRRDARTLASGPSTGSG